MNNIEEIYNQAIELLNKGLSKEEVLVKFAQARDELFPLLETSALLFSLPKNNAPTPAMQRKYALAPIKNFWLTWFHISRLAGLSMSTVLLISAISVIGYQTAKSSPGQTLFAVKKSTEQLRLILASSQNSKASLQIAIAEKRLQEAEEIFNNPNSGVKQKKAALNEVTSQTSNAIKQVNTVAQSNLESDENHPLLNSLDSIAQQQQNLLEGIASGDQIAIEAKSAQQALYENEVKISEIKQSIAIADSDRALAELKASPDSVAVLGTIEEISKNKITVEKNVFAITEQTSIKDETGKTLSLKDLPVKTKVNIIGLKDKNERVALQIILIIPESPKPEVKGLSATTTEASLKKETSATETPVSLKKRDAETVAKEETSSSTTDSLKTDPNTATVSYIFEDPAPQFVD